MENKQNTFLVTYANKKQVTDTVDAELFPNAEAYCKTRYGLTLKETEEYGTSVKQVDAEKPAKEEGREQLNGGKADLKEQTKVQK